VAELVAKLSLVRSTGFAFDVELTAAPGITCVMGPSGSGKSTLLAMLAGLQIPDRGRVAVGDHVWLDRASGVNVPVHERKISYVFQGLALFPHMTALRNVMYGMHDQPRAGREEKAMSLLERVGVGHLAKRRPRTFSGGEAQRVALARAIARSPELILLDEPFSALDRDLRKQLTSLVRELVTEAKVPLVHVTHSVAEARRLADHVVRIDRGKIVARGTPADVLANVTEIDE